jgi:hypothetical protein
MRLFANAVMILFQCASAYLHEAFTLYAASATGAIYIIRGLKEFGFPLFYPSMSQSLGYGWDLLCLLLLLAAPEVGSCCSGYGDRLRARSSDATG